jgi:hypothetical protein
MNEYAFDAHLYAVIRIKAPSEAEARVMLGGIDSASPETPFITRHMIAGATVAQAEISEVSFMGDARYTPIFEVDGVSVE